MIRDWLLFSGSPVTLLLNLSSLKFNQVYPTEGIANGNGCRTTINSQIFGNFAILVPQNNYSDTPTSVGILRFNGTYRKQLGTYKFLTPFCLCVFYT